MYSFRSQKYFEVSCFSFVNLTKELTPHALRSAGLHSVCKGEDDLVEVLVNWMTRCFECALLISEYWVLSSQSSLKCQDNKWLDEETGKRGLVRGDDTWDCQPIAILNNIKCVSSGNTSLPLNELREDYKESFMMLILYRSVLGFLSSITTSALFIQFLSFSPSLSTFPPVLSFPASILRPL